MIQIQITEICSLLMSTDLGKHKLKVAASLCITTYFILLPERELSALKEHKEPRIHNMSFCKLEMLFLIFQNTSPHQYFDCPRGYKLTTRPLLF